MFALKAILTGIHVIISIFLVIVILLQSSKGGGLSGTFGGQASTALFGPRGTANVLSTLTKYLAVGFLVISLTLSLLAGAGSTPQSVTQKVLETSPSTYLPVVEDYNAEGTAAPGAATGAVPGQAGDDAGTESSDE